MSALPADANRAPFERRYAVSAEACASDDSRTMLPAPPRPRRGACVRALPLLRRARGAVAGLRWRSRGCCLRLVVLPPLGVRSAARRLTLAFRAPDLPTAAGDRASARSPRAAASSPLSCDARRLAALCCSPRAPRSSSPRRLRIAARSRGAPRGAFHLPRAAAAASPRSLGSAAFARSAGALAVLGTETIHVSAPARRGARRGLPLRLYRRRQIFARLAFEPAEDLADDRPVFRDRRYRQGRGRLLAFARSGLSRRDALDHGFGTRRDRFRDRAADRLVFCGHVDEVVARRQRLRVVQIVVAQARDRIMRRLGCMFGCRRDNRGAPRSLKITRF